MTLLDLVIALSLLCAVCGCVLTIAALVAGARGDDKLK